MFLNKQDVLQNGYRMVTLSGKIARYKIFVNVGGAEMAFNGGDERIAFGPMAKGQKKYGSTTSSRSKRNEQVVVYNVQRGDTLAGIAIKFGVNTEQIRRVNQLWTNDSLFLRDKLLIPVDPEQSLDGRSDDGELDRSSSYGGNNSNLCSPLGDDSSAGGGFKMQPHWTHPLCDSLDEDCIVVSPESVKLGSRSSNIDLNSSADTWCSSKDSLYANSNMDGGCGAMSNGSHSSSHSPLASIKSKHSSIDNGGTSSTSSYYVGGGNASQNREQQQNHHHNHGHASSSTAPTSPSSASSSRNHSIVDHSEKSAEEFLSRIDSAIATSKKHAKNKAEQDKTAPPWVTFDSDSESSDHRSNSGTSITRQGRHLRYSLRKLEKAQEELFQL